MYVCISANDGKGNISDLETSAILGLMLVGDPFRYDPNQSYHDSWIRGPFTFKIFETLRLPKYFIIPMGGQVGAFNISHEIENEILGRRFVQNTIHGWRQKYGLKLSIRNLFVLFQKMTNSI